MGVGETRKVFGGDGAGRAAGRGFGNLMLVSDVLL